MINGDYIMIVAPPEFPGNKYRGKYCYEHVYVYWKYHKIIPEKNQIIHHLDGNKHNNNINNLILLTVQDHNKLHSSGRKMVRLICPNCGNIFDIERRKSYIILPLTNSFCCKKCADQFQSLPNIEQMERNSKNYFIKEFTLKKPFIFINNIN